MPIISTDLKLYKSETVSDGDTNGGRMSANEIASGAVKNIFPAIGESERTDGSTKYRKVFFKNANADGLELEAPKIFLDQHTPGDDIVTFIVANQTNIQDDITGSEKEYGCGKLDANVSSTATEVDVLVEDGGNHTFEDDDLIRITDMAAGTETGNEEYVTIVGTPSVLGDVVTITFTPALANGYSASSSRVMNVYENRDPAISVSSITRTSGTATATSAAPHGYTTGDTVLITGANQAEYNGEHQITVTGASTFTYAVTGSPATPATGTITAARNANLIARIDDLVVTSSAGTFNSANLLADNEGTVQDDFTLTFTSPTTFTIVGAVTGSHGTGSIGAGAAPDNTAFSAPYWTIQAAGFGGTWAPGDLIEFTSIPAAAAVFMKRVVPAGSGALSVNDGWISLDGETSG
jgi:hypothetical protein